MLLGFGWCQLRSSREPYRNATLDEVDAVDAAVKRADAELFDKFECWLKQNDDPWLQIQFSRELNNHTGLVTFAVSRNHRTSAVWTMLDWIRDNGPGSYGLFYCHDDEDGPGSYEGRQPPMDYDNVFRVHRLLAGRLDELDDPFFGPVRGDVDPVHPYDRRW